jgi:Tat protein translocase TatC
LRQTAAVIARFQPRPRGNGRGGCVTGKAACRTADPARKTGLISFPTPNASRSKTALLEHPSPGVHVVGRRRLVRRFGVCFYFAPEIFNFLAQPLAKLLIESNSDQRFIMTGLAEGFFTNMKLGFFGAMVISFPVFAMQLYKFMAPGLYKHEKSAFVPFLIAAPILFMMGAALLYYVLMPVAWKFFLGFQQPGGEGSLRIELEARIGENVSLSMKLIFAFARSAW